MANVGESFLADDAEKRGHSVRQHADERREESALDNRYDVSRLVSETERLFPVSNQRIYEKEKKRRRLLWFVVPP